MRVHQELILNRDVHWTPFDAQAGIFREISIYNMAVNALALFVTKSSATMVLLMLHKRDCVFHREGFNSNIGGIEQWAEIITYYVLHNFEETCACIFNDYRPIYRIVTRATQAEKE